MLWKASMPCGQPSSDRGGPTANGPCTAASCRLWCWSFVGLAEIAWLLFTYALVADQHATRSNFYCTRRAVACCPDIQKCDRFAKSHASIPRLRTTVLIPLQRLGLRCDAAIAVALRRPPRQLMRESRQRVARLARDGRMLDCGRN
jgi:hypothetical protein